MLAVAIVDQGGRTEREKVIGDPEVYLSLNSAYLPVEID